MPALIANPPAQTAPAAYRIKKPELPKPLPVRQPDLTPMERLLRDSDNISDASTKGVGDAHLYELRGYDPENDIVYIQRSDIQKNPVYGVSRRYWTCDCPYALERVQRVNLRREAAGLPASLVCKHALIVNERELADPSGFEADLKLLAGEFLLLGKEVALYLAVERAFDTDAPINQLTEPVSYSEHIERDFN